VPGDISEERQTAIRTAAEWIGTPYCFGGESKDCTDCSGFVMMVFQSVGVQLPRTAEDQYEFSTKVKRSNLLAGDLVFFKDKKKVSHVGLYVGNNRFIHASSSQGVMSSSLDETYFDGRFCGGGRVLS
jgi:cell wall-associated NlpC family hydrolase